MWVLMPGHSAGDRVIESKEGGLLAALSAFQAMLTELAAGNSTPNQISSHSIIPRSNPLILPLTIP